MAETTFNPNAPRVEGVGLVTYVGKGLDLNRTAALVGTYGTQIGSASHDVFDLPITALHPHVQDLIPDSIASSPDGQVLRLYVAKSQRGQITDIGIVNGAYACPGAPFVPRSGHIYTSPADAEKYRNVAPARVPRNHSGVGYRDQMDRWQPGPGDRFKLIEIE
jgi:hypothetical protein